MILYRCYVCDSPSSWQVLERLIESNGGIREKEPFFLSGSSYDREVF